VPKLTAVALVKPLPVIVTVSRGRRSAGWPDLHGALLRLRRAGHLHDRRRCRDRGDPAGRLGADRFGRRPSLLALALLFIAAPLGLFAIMSAGTWLGASTWG
jgi:hypothetical protein